MFSFLAYNILVYHQEETGTISLRVLNGDHSLSSAEEKEKKKVLTH